MEEEIFKKQCIVAENENYFYVFRLQNELINGHFRIPKRTAKTKSEALTEAFEWSLDQN